MPPAAFASAILVSAAALLLAAASLERLRRFAGTWCLLALTLAGGGLSIATSANRDAAALGLDEIALDSFSLTVCWTALGLGWLLTLSSMQLERLIRGAAPELYAGLLMSLAGLMLVGLARDLIVLGLALELIALSTFLIWAAKPFAPAAHEAAAKLLLLGLLSTCLLWFGIALLYGIAGTTNIADCLKVVAAGRSPIEPESLIDGRLRIALPAAVLLVAGIGMRMHLVPFHFGAAELTDAATTWHAALPATVPKFAGIIALWSLFGHWSEPGSAGAAGNSAVSLLLIVVAAATMAVGSVMARAETTVRRLLASTTMAHGGFALIGVAVGGAAGLFYLAGYLLSITGLFAVLCYLTRRDREVEYLDDLNGLARSEPVAAGCALVCLLSLAGLPPLPLFWGNLFLAMSALTAPAGAEPMSPALTHGGFAALVVVAAVSGLLLASVYLRVIAAMFLSIQVGRPRPSGGQTALAAALIAALLTLGLGLLPAPLLEHLGRIVQRAG